MTTLRLRDVRAILPDGPVDHLSLLIDSDRIAAVAPDNQPAVANEELNLSGTTVFPGFIDVHIHGAVGVDTMEAAPDDLNRVSRFLATRGVTGWMPTLVPAPVADYERAVNSIAAASLFDKGARVLGVHYEGPFVNTAQCGALRKQFFRTYSGPADVADLPVLSESLKHMMTLAPEVEGGIELTRELCSRGWIVSLGHTRAEFDQLDRAHSAGAHHMTHFMNAMAPLHHRSPGPVAWGLLQDDVSCDLIADGVHLDSHILKLLLKTKTAERLTLISDAVAPAGMGDGRYDIWGETISVRDGRTSNENGNIAGSVITMLDGLRMMKSLGASDLELAHMTSTNPARLLGLDHECGSIAEGMRADLVALDQHDNVRLTIVGGQVL